MGWNPAWLSLAGAITWVVTRDMALTKSADERPNNDFGTILGISLHLAQESKLTGQPVNQQIRLADAWPKLRSLIADEKIVAEATPMVFNGTEDGTGVWRTFATKPIPSGEIRNLVVNNSVPGIKLKDALAPNKLGRVSSGCHYWIDVRLRAAAVFREFEAERRAFNADHDEQVGHEKRRGGRRKGSGSYDHHDKPLIDEMKTLIEEGKAVSAEAAARLVADRAKGAGTLESKAERLAKKCRASSNFDRNKSD
jgi:hypothetical protein